MAGEKDSRVTVGGVVWARAEAISRDFKRILGNQFKSQWIKGTVIQVEKRKASEFAKRSTTYVEGKYPCGEDAQKQPIFKFKFLSLGTLKDKDPNAVPTQPVAETTNVAPSVAPVPTAAVAAAATGTATEEGNVQLTPDATNNNKPVGIVPVAAHTNSQDSNRTANTSSTSSSTSSKVPVTTSNDRHWYDGNCQVEVGGKHSSRYWKLQDQYGRGIEFTPGCDTGRDPQHKALDFFLAVFPKKQLKEMQERTSKALLSAQPKPLQPTTVGEILKFFGVLLIITRFEFGHRASLWATSGFTRLVPSANLGEKTGMSRERFDNLWRYLVWSEQPATRPPDMSHEEWRWRLVQDFVDNFNDHRELFFFASWLLCADESISRWYGLGGNWINMGLPHYVAMDRKPEHGCEIQNCCDGLSGIMLRLKLVKSQAAEEAITSQQRQAAADVEVM